RRHGARRGGIPRAVEGASLLPLAPGPGTGLLRRAGLLVPARCGEGAAGDGASRGPPRAGRRAAAVSATLPTTYRRGAWRLVPPEATIERVRPVLQDCGITRCADVTALD